MKPFDENFVIFTFDCVIAHNGTTFNRMKHTVVLSPQESGRFYIYETYNEFIDCSGIMS